MGKRLYYCCLLPRPLHILLDYTHELFKFLFLLALLRCQVSFSFFQSRLNTFLCPNAGHISSTFLMGKSRYRTSFHLNFQTNIILRDLRVYRHFLCKHCFPSGILMRTSTSYSIKILALLDCRLIMWKPSISISTDYTPFYTYIQRNQSKISGFCYTHI